MEESKKVKDIRISIRDLFFFCLSRWRALIIWFIIGAILGAGFGIYNNKVNVSGIYQDEKTLTSNLSEEEIANAKAAASGLVYYINLYDHQVDYIQNSAFQKLNPYAINTIELKYLVKSHEDETKEKNISMVQAYISALSGEEIEKTLSKEFPEEEKLHFYYDRTVVVDTTLQEQGIFTISIYNDDKESLTKVTNAVKRAIEQRKDSVDKKLGETTISLISETNMVKSDAGMYAAQQDNIIDLDIIKENIDIIKDGLTDKEYRYVEYLVSHNTDSPFAGIAINTSAAPPSEGLNISKKWILLGAIGMLILAILCILVKYVISGKLRNSIDLEEEIGIQLISTFDDEKKHHHTKLDKAIFAKRIGRKARSFDANVDLATMKLAMAAERMELKKICIAIGTDVEADTAFLDEIVKACDKAEIVVARDITQNAEAIRTMMGVDGLVLLEQMDTSKYNHIASELQLCESYGVNVIGAIVVE